MLDFGIAMQPPAANPLSYEEHRELGQEIVKMRAKLVQLASVAAGVYGPQSRAAFVFHKANEAMERLAEEMQAQAEADCPGLNAASLYK